MKRHTSNRYLRRWGRASALANAIADSLAPFRTPHGGYRLENEWHFLIASA